MPLPAPILDDRSYVELRDEMVRRIPVYNPEWTDHNASDPGITLIELFAFLGENLLFRFNQIPDATKLTFLRLLGISLLPPTPAEGIIALSARSPGGELVSLGSEATAGSVPFETQHEVDVLPLTSVVVCKAVTHAPETSDEITYVNDAREALGGLSENEEFAYYTIERLTDPNEPGAEPLNLQNAVDGMIWLALLRTRYTDVSALSERILNVGFVPEQEVASMDDVDPCAGAIPSEPAPGVLWQVSTTETTGDRDMPKYVQLKVLEDTTLGLTRTGVVRLQLPKDISTLGVPEVLQTEREGAGDQPPVLDDEEETANLLFWIRAARIKDDRPFGRTRWLGINATEVRQCRSASPEFLGTGTGQPRQEYALVRGSVIAASLVLQVKEADRWTTWEEVDTLATSQPDDRHYTLDRETGTISFGNGQSGRAPQEGEQIRALTYRYGGGTQGNVAAKAISRIVTNAAVKAENPLRTEGGWDGESIADALDRIPGEIRRHDRAVTASDFAELALMTPGAYVGRAETLARFYPPTRMSEAAGVVTVVVWPQEDPNHPNAPLPTRAMLSKVCEYLDARRLITTELWVIPPTYRKIAVSVGVNVKSDYGVEAVRRWVEQVVRQYLAPLPPYGPEGNGWPLGRRVHGPELEAAVLQVEGVAYLEDDVRLAAWSADDNRWVEFDPTIELALWEVPELWEISVVEGIPLEPGKTVGPVVPTIASEEEETAAEPPVPGSSEVAVPSGDFSNRPIPVAVPLPLPRSEC